MKQQVVTDDTLSTLMCIVESIVNNRPITSVSSDPNDLEPLTPSHLLTLRSTENLPGQFHEADLYKRSWRQAQYLSDIFWRRWVREYLPTLQLRSKWDKETRNMQPGDIVLVTEPNQPRNSWPLGRVIDVVVSEDDVVRSAHVKTKNGTFLRPVNKLYLLEAFGNNEHTLKEAASRGRFESEE